MGFVRWFVMAMAFEIASRLPFVRCRDWAASVCLELDLSRFRLW